MIIHNNTLQRAILQPHALKSYFATSYGGCSISEGLSCVCSVAVGSCSAVRPCPNISGLHVRKNCQRRSWVTAAPCPPSLCFCCCPCECAQLLHARLGMPGMSQNACGAGSRDADN